jgi:hypothetical protein
MKSFYFLMTTALICLLFACSKGNNSTTQNEQKLIIGKWTQLQQHNIINTNGVKTTDTMITTANGRSGNINFLTVGTFTSAGYYYSPQNPPNPTPISLVSSDSTSGVFSFKNNVFDLTAGVAGFPGDIYFTVNEPGISTFKLVSHNDKIIQLTSTTLNLQTDYFYTTTGLPTVTSYEYLNVYYFTR